MYKVQSEGDSKKMIPKKSLKTNDRQIDDMQRKIDELT